MKKIAIVVGHTEKKQGAMSPFLKEPYDSEFNFNSYVADNLENTQIDIYTYDPSLSGYYARVDKLAEEINKQDYEAVFELHFNGCENPDANGTEALYFYNSRKGKKYAFLFCQLFSSNFKTKNRFEKGLYNRKQRGYYFLKAIKAPAVILEPIFGSSEEDVSKLNRDSYVSFLKYYINDFILK